MQKPYTVRLAARQFTTTGDYQVYTAPSGFTTILRHAIIFNADQTAQILDLYVALVSPTGNVRIYRGSVAPTTVVAMDLRQVLLPGDIVHFLPAGTGGSVMLTGYQFAS
jgi:hypothetical protein